MNLKKALRTLASLCLAALLLGSIPAARATAAQDRIASLEAQLAAIDAQIAADASDPEKAAQVQGYYAQKSETLKEQIGEINTQITDTQAALEEKQQLLEQKVLAVAYAQELFGQRLAGIYMMHNDSSLSVLLGLTGWDEVLRYTENLERIALQDDATITRLREEQAEMERQVAAVQADLDALTDSNTQLAAKSDAYAQSLQLSDGLSEAEAQAQAENAAYAQQRALQEEAEDSWAKWIAADDNLNIVFGGGTFRWPIPGYTTLSSEWGIMRNVNGYKRVHSGIDIPAPAGTPIYAAGPGVVTTTAHWSYGTCAKINHGSGLVTVYGHMSARVVKDGDTVETGQLIGYVGSTGNSTGNHLHFEVDLNGHYVNPFDYLNN